MELSPFPSRSVLQTLIGSSILRCIAAKSACRVTVSIRCFYESKTSPHVQISIADTGTGCSIEELRNFAEYCLKTLVKWDGILSATTTSIVDKDISKYHFNIKETASSMLTRLSLEPKNGSKFSGTQISLTTEVEESLEEYLGWVEGFIRKVLILNIPMIAFEILVDHVKDNGSTLDHVQFADSVFLPVSLSNIECITSGLQVYLLRHGNVLNEDCPLCFANKDNLKVGNGRTSNENRKGSGLIVEVVISIFNSDDASNNHCLWPCSSSTNVLFFQDFVPCPIVLSAYNAVKGINWQDYGLSLRSGVIDANGHAVLEWENLLPKTRVDITLHCYHKEYQTLDVHFQGLPREPDKNVVKKAIKLALDNLKSKHAGVLLSNHALKIRSYIPDLSRSIASLIMSSKDTHFLGECASLLGLKPLDISSEGILEFCIRDKITEIIDANDRNPKRSRRDKSTLFEFEHEDNEENDAEDEHFALEYRF